MTLLHGQMQGLTVPLAKLRFICADAEGKT